MVNLLTVGCQFYFLNNRFLKKVWLWLCFTVLDSGYGLSLSVFSCEESKCGFVLILEAQDFVRRLWSSHKMLRLYNECM